MKKVIVIAGIILLNSIIWAQQSKPVKLYADKSKSSITYSMNHPLHSWSATNNEITSIILTDESKNSISQVAVSVKVSNFDSKNANRDSHMIEATEALKYPNITFSSNSVMQEGDKLKITGTLNFHGVNQVISFEASENKTKNKLEVKGGFVVLMTDFKIEPPSLMAIATDNEIKINFDLLF